MTILGTVFALYLLFGKRNMGHDKWAIEQKDGTWIVEIPTGNGSVQRVECQSEGDAQHLAYLPSLQLRFRSAADVTEIIQLESLKDDQRILARYGLDRSPFARWIDGLVRDAEHVMDE
jgi:hypothetical protein